MWMLNTKRTQGKPSKGRSAIWILKALFGQIGELFSTPIMRVTPHSVLEGGRMTLTCDTSLSRSRSTTELQYTFYKDGKKVQGPSSSKQYELQLAHLNDSATYNCEVSARDNTKKKLSQEEYIQIQEIFSVPQIQVDPYPVVEGGPMTLTCDTSLRSYIRTKDLQYTFYRDWRTVQGPSSSREYKVQSTDLEDSGNYKCEISTTNGVRKQSQEKHITVQELFRTPRMKVDPHLVVEGDPMTLTCNAHLNQYGKTTVLRYTFYKDGRQAQGPNLSKRYTVQHVKQGDSGYYKCEVSTTNGVKKLSREQYILVQELFFHPNIIIKSNPVVEGDHMILTCNTILNSQRPTTDLKFVFYRDGEKVQEYNSSNTYEIQSVQVVNSGDYSCEVSAANTVKKGSQKKYMNIQELFAIPQMKVEPDPVVEGDNMTLTCNVTLSPYRATTELQYTFYRDGRTDQEPGSSTEYKVQPVKPRDSGNYKCEVSTTNGVKKLSQEQHIAVQELFTDPKININQNLMALTCNTSVNSHRPATDLQFAFYRDGEKESDSSDTYEIPAAQSQNSGNYSCKVSGADTVRKVSQMKFINVQEMVPHPLLTIKPEPVREGDHMVLTCDTSLSSYRSNTDLKFAFYRDGEKVQDFGSLNTYEIQSVQPKDSGDYFCEVLLTNTMKIESLIQLIQVLGYQAG
ncbi:Fc receptor-like protein 2 [Dendropsophus ebraccatus]|uniref:Fc receptor-like protein 2 n=1 Tax=Dendropsophus ebraccatus TaxID=150705 RepID=UPI0038321337